MRSLPRRFRRLAVLAIVFGLAFAWQQFGPGEGPRPERGAPSSATSPGARTSDAGSPEAPAASRTAIGFRSPAQLATHFDKHGAEFRAGSAQEYLRLAQDLRDRPSGGNVLERTRADGVTTRFDRASGAFLAVNRDGSIRTFFRPNQGETYFWRQLERRN